jgi:hypothetical protein
MANKIKVRFGREEWYPVYEETEDEFYSTVIELTQYELFKVRRVLQEFNHVQTMIETKIQEAEREL